MSSEGFWNCFKILLKKTGYLKKEDAYNAYIGAYSYYLSHDEVETWERFVKICDERGYKPDEWVEYTFKTLLASIKDIDKGFSHIFGKALRENKICI